MGFLYFSKYFMFIAFDFLYFELMLRFEIYDVQILIGFWQFLDPLNHNWINLGN